jgi:hypothetical protein
VKFNGFDHILTTCEKFLEKKSDDKAFTVCTCRLKLKMEELLLLVDVHKSRMMANIEEVWSRRPFLGEGTGGKGGNTPVPHPEAQVGRGGGAGAQGQGDRGEGWLLLRYCPFKKWDIEVGRRIRNNFFRIRIQEAQQSWLRNTD